jgi:hypothetical protein
VVSDARVPSHRPFHGPFDARHAGVPARRIRIHALSVSGCVIDSPNPFVFGQRIGLKIDLAGEGWITVDAEALGPRPGGGYAVKFVNLGGANRARIERTIERPLTERTHGAWTLDVR